MGEFSSNLSTAGELFSSTAGFFAPALKQLGDLFSGISDLGTGLLYMYNRVLETLGQQ